jgi:hypothetical protein
MCSDFLKVPREFQGRKGYFNSYRDMGIAEKHIVLEGTIVTMGNINSMTKYITFKQY